MKILLVGGGGREHALAWKLKQSRDVTEIVCAPGNAGISNLARCIPIAATDLKAICSLAKEEKPDLVVIGPDDPLALGLSDLLRQEGFPCFGPGRKAALIESSKTYAKEFMLRHGIPCARHRSFLNPEEAMDYCRKNKPPYVIKADGLALGKGVRICQTLSEAEKTLADFMVDKVFGSAGEQVVIEEFLEGIECSIHALVDGHRYLLFPDARDHKRAFDGNTGPNTGGMGTIAPSGALTEQTRAHICKEILDRFLIGLQKDKIEFRGLLFPGLMITKEGPKVLEFNVRFGDPETQSLVRLIKGDFAYALFATANGNISDINISFLDAHAICLILASGGYPGNYRRGLPIFGLEKAVKLPSVEIFHAGTTFENGQLVTSGGRVLGISAVADSLQQAREVVYRAAEEIHFEGMFYRRDIGVV
ncbi:MAG: phosphoribosylamine--glycine ligase [Chthoniobacterales bacterium]|nr:phosphoribosylamine--glycine ligase [Chthoniobacterales bacterium]